MFSNWPGGYLALMSDSSLSISACETVTFLSLAYWSMRSCWTSCVSVWRAAGLDSSLWSKSAREIFWPFTAATSPPPAEAPLAQAASEAQSAAVPRAARARSIRDIGFSFDGDAS